MALSQPGSALNTSLEKWEFTAEGKLGDPLGGAGILLRGNMGGGEEPGSTELGRIPAEGRLEDAIPSLGVRHLTRY